MPQIDNEQHDECVNIVDTVHDMAHKGLFKKVNLSTFRAFMDVAATLLNVHITPKQAEEVFPNAGKVRIKNVLARKISSMHITKLREGTNFVPWAIWKKFLG